MVYCSRSCLVFVLVSVLVFLLSLFLLSLVLVLGSVRCSIAIVYAFCSFVKFISMRSCCCRLRQPVSCRRSFDESQAWPNGSKNTWVHTHTYTHTVTRTHTVKANAKFMAVGPWNAVKAATKRCQMS